MNPSPPLLTSALLAHARDRPDAIAFAWLDGDQLEPTRVLTYGALVRDAQTLAASLRARDLTGQRVLLVFPSGLDFVVAFLGCLYAGAIAVPAPFPSNRRTLARVAALAADCRPALALTLESQRPLLAARLIGDGVPPCAALETEIVTGTTLLSPALDANPPTGSITAAPAFSPPPDTLAYLQYTSGTGGTAKGVRVTHRNLAHNLLAMSEVGPLTSEDALLSWLPHHHDMQLVTILARSLALGARCVLMSPIDFLQRPLRWLRALSHHQAAFTVAPNFAYELCLRRITDADLAGLDLSRLRSAGNSAERHRPATLDNVARRFAPIGFTPGTWMLAYGLAEATAFVSGSSAGTPPRQQLSPESGLPVISSGIPRGGDRVFIADPENGGLLPAQAVGEILVHGGSITTGYWDRPAENDRLFRDIITAAGAPVPRCLRTGDLGFLDSGGHLYVTGRLKELIILRGQNHHPEDIEAVVDASHPSLRPGELAAFSTEEPGALEERLVIVAELERAARIAPDVPAIAEAVRIALNAALGLVLDRLVLLPPGGLPKTTSGKPQRGVCRRALLSGAIPVLAEWHRHPPRATPSLPPPHPSDSADV